jgi:hypothetical protein
LHRTAFHGVHDVMLVFRKIDILLDCRAVFSQFKNFRAFIFAKSADRATLLDPYLDYRHLISPEFELERLSDHGFAFRIRKN